MKNIAMIKGVEVEVIRDYGETVEVYIPAEKSKRGRPQTVEVYKEDLNNDKYPKEPSGKL